MRSPPRAAASELLPRLLLCHADAPAPLGSRQHALCCRPPSERLAGPLSFVTAFDLRRAPYARPGLCVSRVRPTHPRLSRGRACASRIARTCIARLRPSAAQPDAANFCNGYGLRHPLYPNRPLRLTSAAIAPASTFCMRLHLGSRTGPPALPDFPPVPRSDGKHSFLPRNCSAAWPGSGARQPEPLASHAL